MALTAPMQLTDQDVRTTSTTQGGAQLGQYMSTPDGRTYRYGLNGTGSGTAIAPGKLMQGALSLANHQNRTGVTAAAGTATVTFAVGATLVSSNQYAQGYLVVNAGTGAGQQLLISGNTSAASSGSPTVNLADEIITATLASDSKFSLMPHPYSAVILSNQAAATAIYAVGVPAISVPDASYAWLQTVGPCSVLANGTIAVAAGLIPGATTSGSVDAEGTSSVQPRVGYMLIASVSTEYRSAYLTINQV